jgi:hypothetical protein
VSGRRPFAKDPLLNYEYDSEAEWEEEDPEGEDIALSDNEEDAEGDEIIYDDFFRPDNELDDPDGDPDAMAPSSESSLPPSLLLTLCSSQRSPRPQDDSQRSQIYRR